MFNSYFDRTRGYKFIKKLLVTIGDRKIETYSACSLQMPAASKGPETRRIPAAFIMSSLDFPKPLYGCVIGRLPLIYIYIYKDQIMTIGGVPHWD